MTFIHGLSATLFRELLRAGLEIDNEKAENNSIFDNSKKSREFLDSIMKIKSRDYRLIDNVKSILFTDSVDSERVSIFSC